MTVIIAPFAITCPLLELNLQGIALLLRLGNLSDRSVPLAHSL
ncbi:hypothetical protein [Scytonema hofmannii]|nr:hypothetical protein [Scytonema hofmannii]